MRRASRLLGRLFFYLLVVFVVVYSVFPFYWAVISSFKPSDALFSPDPSFLPVPFTLEHYENVFLQANFGRNLLNSLIVAPPATMRELRRLRPGGLPSSPWSSASSPPTPWGGFPSRPKTP